MDQTNAGQSEFNLEIIFSLPNDKRLGYVLGMNFDVYEQLTRGTAKNLLKNFQEHILMKMNLQGQLRIE